jgi:hypothetical protein
MTDLREEFEAFSKRHYLLRELDKAWNNDADEYCEPELQLAFEAWQASRAALKVELPATCNRALLIPNDEDDGLQMMHDEYFEVDDIKQMLTDAGISYD